MTRHIHDLVARSYNSDHGIIAEKNREVAAALARRWRHRIGTLRILDLGVGDGAMLERLAALPHRFDFTGIDISAAMLDQARRRVPLRTIRASATEAGLHLRDETFDLVLAHFILAYVPPAPLLRQAARLLAPGGVVSLVTSTNHGAGPLMAQLDRRFRRSPNPLRRLVARAVDRGMAMSSVPDGIAELEAVIRAAGLRVDQRHSRMFPVLLEGPDDAFRMAFDEGWAANVLDAPAIPPSVMRVAARRALDLFDYPHAFDQQVEILELVEG